MVIIISLFGGGGQLAAASGPLQTPSDVAAGGLKKRDPSLMISLDALLQMLDNGREIVIVDIRDRAEFNRFRIPGSINVPLHFIKTKLFFKTKSLVLVDEGYAYSQLEKECHNLKKVGFTVAILNGGLNCWRRHQGPLQGDRLAQRSLNIIPPSAFFQEKEYDHWLVIDVSESPLVEASRLLYDVFHIPFLNDSEKAIGRLSKIVATVAKQRKTHFFSVLIFNQDGEGYDRFEKLIEKTDVKNVFYLQGGLKEYRRFLQNLTLSQKPKNKRIKSLRKCKTCGR